MIKKSISQPRCLHRKQIRNLRFGLVLLAGFCALHDSVTLAADDTSRPSRPRRQQTGSAANEEGVALPYSRIARDSEPPYENLFRDVRTGGLYSEKLGPADAVVQANAFGPRLNVPLVSPRASPKDAELKFGRFYLDVEALSASLLYSDNVDLSEDNRNDGVISILRLTSSFLFQITDNARIAVRGTLVYLPMRNAVGIAGFGIDDPMMEFDAMPLFQAQLTLDKQVGGWDVEVIDDLRVRQQRFGFGMDSYEGEDFDEQDRVGRYHYRYRQRPPGRSSRNEDYYVEGRNLVGASASRLLPTATRLEFGGYHANYYYNDTFDRDLPNSRDTVYALLASERQTVRFKPFIRYRATTTDNRNGWGESIRAGVHGPVTENLHLLANAGYYWRTDTDYTTYLARLTLRHIFNPLTYQQFTYYRGESQPYDEITDLVSYRLRHIFREDLYGQFHCSYAQYTDPQTGQRTGLDRRIGLRFVYALAPRTSLRVSGAYGEFRNSDPEGTGQGAEDYDEWIARTELFHIHTASLQTRLIYQYRDRMSDIPGQSYWENLVVLTLTKYF